MFTLEHVVERVARPVGEIVPWLRDTRTGVILATPGTCTPRRLRGRSHRTSGPRKPLDAPEDLPEEAPRQVALGEPGG